MTRPRYAKGIRVVVFALLLGMGGSMTTACSADAWRPGAGESDPYKNACRSEGCAF